MIRHSLHPQTVLGPTLSPLPMTVPTQGRSWYRSAIKSGNQIIAPRHASINQMILKMATMKASKLATFLPRVLTTFPSTFDIGIEAIGVTNVIPLNMKCQISLKSDPPARIEITMPHVSLPVPIKQFGGRNLPQ